MGEHLGRGEYGDYLHHLVVIQLSCMAMGEEVARELLSDEDMEKLQRDSMDGLAGATAILMRELRDVREEHKLDGGDRWRRW